MKTRCFACVVSLLSLVAAASVLRGQQAAPAPTQPVSAKPAVTLLPESAVVPVPRPGKWIERHNLINSRAVPGQVDVIFLGDSITAGWEGNGKDAWAKHFAPRKAMNAGIGGDRTQHILWRLDHGNVEGHLAEARP